MTDMEITTAARPLTPRQDRLESEIAEVLRRGGTRSSLRVLVEELADHARLQRTPPEDAIGAVRAIAQHAGPAMIARGESAVGDSVSDRVTMMVRWIKARYRLAD